MKKSKNELQKEYRAKTNNLATKKYEKTKKGFLMRAYRNMLSRTKGLVKPHIYKGLSILTREDFYNWAVDNTNFNSLFETWETDNYSRKLTPSVNRINPKLGYTLDNIEWITHSENSRLGTLSKGKKVAFG